MVDDRIRVKRCYGDESLEFFLQRIGWPKVLKVLCCDRFYTVIYRI